MSLRHTSSSGSAVVALVLVMPFLLLIAAYFMNLTVSNFKLSRGDQRRTQAQFAADAGVDISLKEINEDENWAGTAGEIELQNNSNVRTTYDVTVADVDADNKDITAIGRTYHPATASSPSDEIAVEVELRPVRSGSYSVVTGVGGLYLSNNSKILGGDVLVNGEVQMSNSSQIGLSTNPITMDVAHQNCPNPPDATYPRVCNSGENGQPINMTNNSHIYGSVSANNQTDGSDMSDPGLVESTGVAPQPLPEHDRDAQKAAVAQTQSGGAASCWSGSPSTVTWPANLKVEGNVNISGQCQVIVTGDVWITGRLNLSNQASMKVSDALGGTRPNIMVDGSATAVNLSNGSALLSNGSNTGFQVITYWSEAACSPDCPDVTGHDLYDSRDATTIAMSNSSSAPETVLYARWSRVQISNSGAIGALIGQTVRMSNNATITFGTSTGGGGTTFWVVDRYRRLFL